MRRAFWKGLRTGFKKFGGAIGTVINSLLLTTLYFLGVGLTSLVAKLFRKRFLELKTDGKRKSYWKELDIGEKPQEEYYRQF